MSRIRTVKPELFKHSDLFDAEEETGLPVRVAFIGLFTVADREGRFKWKPRELKVDVLPYDMVDFSRVLDALTTRGFIKKYTVDGVDYGLICTFTEHQVINNRETPSKLPEPPQDIDSIEDLTRDPRVLDASPTRHGNAQGEGKGREGKGKEGDTCSEPSASKPPAVISIPTNRFNTKGEEYPVTQNQIDEWQSAYPGVDVLQMLHRIRSWNVSNPGKRKTMSGMAKHIDSWLAKEQNTNPRPPGLNAPTPLVPRHKPLQQIQAEQEAELEEIRRREGKL